MLWAISKLIHFYTPNEKLIPKSIILPRHNIPKFIRKNQGNTNHQKKLKKPNDFKMKKFLKFHHGPQNQIQNLKSTDSSLMIQYISELT
jgi:hypothetical protein